MELAASICLCVWPPLAGIQHSLCRCSLSCSSSQFTRVTNLLVVVSQCCHITASRSITPTETGLHIAGMYYCQRAISVTVISRISFLILVAKPVWVMWWWHAAKFEELWNGPCSGFWMKQNRSLCFTTCAEYNITFSSFQHSVRQNTCCSVVWNSRYVFLGYERSCILCVCVCCAGTTQEIGNT
jgi:hypothetical protein